jgi:selenocysteine-specific elongation factor
LVAARRTWEALAAGLETVLAAYHAANPLRAGMPREEVKSRLAQGLDPARRARFSAKVFAAAVALAVEQGRVGAAGALVRLPGHRVRFSPAQHTRVQALLAGFRRDPYNTPSPKEAAAQVGDDVLAALIEQGELVAAAPDVLFLAETYSAMVERIRAHLQAQGKITVAEVRDMFGTSRKYALGLMEFLDAQGITRRVGDERVLRA